jgi:hypothetical protein
MRYESYQLEIADSLMTFEFISKGSKGFFKKRIKYEQTGRDNFYNLAFGDVDIDTDEINDEVVTDNKDTLKVLATVAKTVNIFLHKYPNARIYAKGSTTSRTRLYRIGISNNLEEISENYKVYGLLEESSWVEYEKNNDYSAFLILKKK